MHRQWHPIGLFYCLAPVLRWPSVVSAGCLFPHDPPIQELHSRSGPAQNGEVYTDQMSQELIGTIIAAIALAAILVPGQWALRRDIAALGESTRKDIESVRKDIAALSERMARLEGLFEGFTKSSPQ